jgi:hypothetical protein
MPVAEDPGANEMEGGDMPQALFFLLLLACPLAMVFMMRGMHSNHGRTQTHEAGAQHGAGHGGCHAGAGHDHEPVESSLDDLRTRRAELDREITARELAERSTSHVHN